VYDTATRAFFGVDDFAGVFGEELAVEEILRRVHAPAMHRRRHNQQSLHSCLRSASPQITKRAYIHRNRKNYKITAAAAETKAACLGKAEVTADVAAVEQLRRAATIAHRRIALPHRTHSHHHHQHADRQGDSERLQVERRKYLTPEPRARAAIPLTAAAVAVAAGIAPSAVRIAQTPLLATAHSSAHGYRQVR
jgi:hypothetical protein